MKVFISYSHLDKKFVRLLSRALEHQSIEIWLDDHQLLIGDSLPQRITSAIHNVDWVLLVISPNSIASAWVYHEIELTIKRERRENQTRLLPLFLQGEQLPTVLAHRLFADFRRADLMREAFPRLLRSMGIPEERIARANMVEVKSEIIGAFLSNPATQVKGGWWQGGYSGEPFEDVKGNRTAYVRVGQLVNPETMLGRVGGTSFDVEVELFPECNGIIRYILVENMQVVVYGQVLMVIEKTDV